MRNLWMMIGDLIYLILQLAARLIFWGGVVVLACSVAFLTIKVLS